MWFWLWMIRRLKSFLHFLYKLWISFTKTVSIFFSTKRYSTEENKENGIKTNKNKNKMLFDAVWPHTRSHLWISATVDVCTQSNDKKNLAVNCFGPLRLSRKPKWNVRVGFDFNYCYVVFGGGRKKANLYIYICVRYA